MNSTNPTTTEQPEKLVLSYKRPNWYYGEYNGHCYAVFQFGGECILEEYPEGKAASECNRSRFIHLFDCIAELRGLVPNNIEIVFDPPLVGVEELLKSKMPTPEQPLSHNKGKEKWVASQSDEVEDVEPSTEQPDKLVLLFDGQTKTYKGSHKDYYFQVAQTSETIWALDKWYNYEFTFRKYHYSLSDCLDEIRELLPDVIIEISNDPAPEQPTQSLRYNEGKPQWSLIHWESLLPMVRVLEFGATKYLPDNWKKGQPKRQLLDSMFRHLTALADGQENDPESGLSHIGHLMCNAMFYAYYTITNNPIFNGDGK